MQNRSRVVGLTQFKNKPSRNAFDKTHRHMFTTNFGQILPIFCEWLNPGETIKLGYNGFTRTQPLQTAAFTRLKENVQYFFVPFQSLWKYFEVQVNNLKTGQNGQNVSPFADSFSSASVVSTSLPYVNYRTLHDTLYNEIVAISRAIISYYNSKSILEASVSDILKLDSVSSHILNGSYRYVLSARLLTSLGYGNFSFYDTYDVIAQLKAFASHGGSWTVDSFKNDSVYGLGIAKVWSNSPNLSIFPLLAYHRIINDYYKYRQWQPLEPWTFNIDYITPSSSSMAFDSNFNASLFSSRQSSMLDMEFSNLPLDYFLGVLPTPQFGEESAVPVISTKGVNLPVSGTISTASFNTNTVTTVKQVGSTSSSVNGSLSSVSGSLQSNGVNARLENQHTHTINNSYAQLQKGTEFGDLRISELRNALALQKYKEIQNANDSDFVSQVLAHFGVKPSTTQMKSRFISGGDSVLQINPEVNSNLVDGASADIKATVTGQLKCSGTFTADTFGVVLGLYRCTPVLDYAHIGIDRNLFKTDATDFPIPEFDSVGMQTQFACEVAAPSLAYHDTDNWIANGKSDLSRTYGYLPRYAELKTSFDRFDGAFCDSLRSWVTGFDYKALHNLWIGDPDDTRFHVSSMLVCTPDLTANLFENSLSLTSNDDKLLIGSVNTAVVVRPYSVYGLPYTN
jgi:hypothetical protein